MSGTQKGNAIRKTWRNLNQMNFRLVRERLGELPKGADCGLNREEALELISRIERYCQLYLREYGTRLFLLDCIRNARKLPRQNRAGKWPFCPDEIECHPAGCAPCWREYALARGEILYRETRGNEEIF